MCGESSDGAGKWRSQVNHILWLRGTVPDLRLCYVDDGQDRSFWLNVKEQQYVRE